MNKVKSDERDIRIEKLEKELKFARNQIANVLSLYDDAKQEAENAMRAKGEFISKLSHEFRTPMNALMGYSDLLIRKDENEATRMYVTGIKSATNRLLNLFNDLIEVSRIESGITVSNNEEYDMAILINTLMDSFYNEVTEKGLLVKLNFDEHLPSRLYGDFYHLRQIVCNLLDNAVKYTEQGYVSLEINAKKGEELSKNGRKLIMLTFCVKDTGVGIKKKDKDNLFDAFSQFNKDNPYANQGVGVGLMVAKYYSNKMHGDITFESRYGEGSTFVCTVIQEIVDETPVNVKNIYDGKTKREILFTAPSARVLVVDDSVVNLNVAKGLLQDYGINADAAEGGMEALKKVGRKNYDLIFMDHMMPDIDGIETMKRIRDKGNWCEEVPIIALTANATDEARQLFRMEGMQDFLAKPIELGLLRDILLKWIPKDKIVFGDVSQGYLMEKDITVENSGTAFTKERLMEDGIDLEKGLTYFAGNLEAYKSTMEDILKDCTKKVNLAEKYLENRDLKNYAIEAHSIKSVAASVGAEAFSQLAKENELKAKDGDLDFVAANGPIFITKYRAFLDSIENILQEEYQKRDASAVNEIEPMGSKLAMDEIKSIIEEAVAALKDFETDMALEKIGRLLGQQDMVDMIEKLYMAQEKIDDFEYDDAVDILNGIISA